MTYRRFGVGAVWTDGTLLNPVYKWRVYDTHSITRGGLVRHAGGLFKTEEAALKRAASLEEAYKASQS